MAGAIASARTGVETVLVEPRPRSGGTVAHSLIHTLAGLFDSEGELLNRGLPAELIERLQAADSRVKPRRMGHCRVLNVAPDVYQRVTEEWLTSERSLRVIHGSRVSEVRTSGKQIREVTIQTPEATFPVFPRAAIDATGNGSLVELISPDHVEDDRMRAAGGLILRLRGVPPGSLAFPKGLGVVRSIRAAALAGELPSVCEHAWIDSGIEEDEIYLKLFVPLADGWREQRVQDEIAKTARGTAEKTVAFLRCLPELASAVVAEIGELGVRDGGRLRGEYQLTVLDVRQGRTFDDDVCRCAWPIEYWHPETGIQLETLPERHYYEIPLRALRLEGFKNVWMAGKCLSADHLAQSSARMVGSCWAMGEAAGSAAARTPEGELDES